MFSEKHVRLFSETRDEFMKTRTCFSKKMMEISKR